MKITHITPEQQARFGEWAQKWIDIGLSTEPADFDAAEQAALRAYDLCNLKRPKTVLRVGSPHAATVDGAVAVLVSNELGRVRDQVKSQIESQVESRVRSQIWLRVRSQVESQIESQIWSKVESQVGSQVRFQVWSQTWEHVGSQVASQVAKQVRSQVRTRTELRVESQVWSQIGSQVGSQVRSQVRSRVESRVEPQAESQVGSQIRSRVEDQVWAQAGGGVNNDRGGAFWSGGCAYITFLRDVLGWRDESLSAFEIEETLAKSVGWVWWHEDVLALSDRPESLNRDERGRLHCEDGPSIKYRDGWSLWHWHGVAAPQDVIENPDSITVGRIRGEKNAEVRRVMAERYGYERYIQDAGLTLVDECPADHPIIGLRTARLFRDGNGDGNDSDNGDDSGEGDELVLLDVLNSTPEPDGSVRRYVLPIDPQAYDGRAGRECLAACASTWRKRSDPEQLMFETPEQYAPVAES